MTLLLQSTMEQKAKQGGGVFISMQLAQLTDDTKSNGTKISNSMLKLKSRSI